MDIRRAQTDDFEDIKMQIYQPLMSKREPCATIRGDE
jgi:hypothetical protein